VHAGLGLCAKSPRVSAAQAAWVPAGAVVPVPVSSPGGRCPRGGPVTGRRGSPSRPWRRVA